MKASKQVGNYSDDAQHIIDRQHSALILMSMILDDVRRGYPRLSDELDRIIQQAIDNAGTGSDLAERLERKTWDDSSQAPASGEVEPVAEVRKFGYGRLRTTLHWLANPDDYGAGTKLYTHPPKAQGVPEGRRSSIEDLRCQQCGNLEPFHATGCATEFGAYTPPAAPDMGGEV